MPVCPHKSKVVKELLDAGIIPQRCTKWVLISDANDVVKIVTEVLVTEDEFRKVADALLRNRDEAREMVQTVVKSCERSKSDEGIRV